MARDAPPVEICGEDGEGGAIERAIVRITPASQGCDVVQTVTAPVARAQRLGRSPTSLADQRAVLLAEARKQHTASAAVVARGVAGKYQALREAQVCGWAHAISVLEELTEEAG